MSLTKPKNYNSLVIVVLSTLYILLITKFADIWTSKIEDVEQSTINYVMIVYFLSIVGLIIAYLWIDTSISNGNYVVKQSLVIGGFLTLGYTMLNYWEYLDDYAKLIMLTFTTSIVLYYVYK